MRKLTQFVVIGLLFAATMRSPGQTEPAKPGPEVQTLGYFLGNWNIDAQINGVGKMTGTEHTEWLPGGFFLITHYEFKTRYGTGSEVEIRGYNPAAKVFTYDSFDNTGNHQTSTAVLKGNTWTYSSGVDKKGHVLGHVICEIVSSTSYRFRLESWNGASWSTVIQGTTTRLEK